MTAQELAAWLCDEFHDWIDGDDWVETYSYQGGDEVTVVFQSKSRW